MEIPNIFEPSRDHRYMACIGENGFSDEATYSTGFLAGSEAMLRQIVKNNADGPEMDTLVYPILYSIRHGIELGIKHLLIKVHSLDENKYSLNDIQNHDLADIWKIWKTHAPFDRRLSQSFDIMKNIIEQIHQADPTGQEFRYNRDRDQNKNLKNKWTVDLRSVGQILKITKDQFEKLFLIIEVIVEERKLKAYTSKFNRDELNQLSIDLPDHETWSEDLDSFLEVKNQYKKTLKIGSNKFSEGINFIKKHPEFAGNIGLESQMIYLTKKDLFFIINKHIEYLQWCGPQDDDFSNLFDAKIPEEPMPDYETLALSLSANAIGEFRALADIGRNNDYSERFSSYREHLTPNDTDEMRIRDFRHFFTKLNLLPSLVKGLQKIGAKSLAEEVFEAQEKHQLSIGHDK